MGRKRTIGWRARIAGAVLLAAMLAGAWFWWQWQRWQPDRTGFPDQGVYLPFGAPEIDLRAARATGARFVYLDASAGAARQRERFSDLLAAAEEAGLRVGAVHRFDPCSRADGQSANFVTMVPREAALLPPAIALDAGGDECPRAVGEAALESELTTLINQVETHSDRPVILRIGPEFEARYGFARRFDRNLWLTRDRFEPTYAGRPWLLWTANAALVTDASEEPLAWVVARP